MAKRLQFWEKSVLTILRAVAGWAIFDLVRLLFEGILDSWGVTSVFWQRLIVILVVVLILIVVGYSWKRAVKTLTR